MCEPRRASKRSDRRGGGGGRHGSNQTTRLEDVLQVLTRVRPLRQISEIGTSAHALLPFQQGPCTATNAIGKPGGEKRTSMLVPELRMRLYRADLLLIRLSLLRLDRVAQWEGTDGLSLRASRSEGAQRGTSVHADHYRSQTISREDENHGDRIN